VAATSATSALEEQPSTRVKNAALPTTTVAATSTTSALEEQLSTRVKNAALPTTTVPGTNEPSGDGGPNLPTGLIRTASLTGVVLAGWLVIAMRRRRGNKA
jgi:hypothetical protein